jgi:hypothetical protein
MSFVTAVAKLIQPVMGTHPRHACSKDKGSENLAAAFNIDTNTLTSHLTPQRSSQSSDEDETKARDARKALRTWRVKRVSRTRLQTLLRMTP